MMRRMGELILLRHGETEWSRELRHTGRTDVPLTQAGEAAATALAPAFAPLDVRAVFTSPTNTPVRKKVLMRGDLRTTRAAMMAPAAA